jgi:hypothetical protein
MPVDQLGRGHGVLAGDGMGDGLLRQASLHVPCGGAPVHPQLLAGFAPPEL